MRYTGGGGSLLQDQTQVTGGRDALAVRELEAGELVELER